MIFSRRFPRVLVLGLGCAMAGCLGQTDEGPAAEATDQTVGARAVQQTPDAINREEAPAAEPGGESSEASAAEEEILEHASLPWTGDLPGMVERGFIRILTVHNPLFFSFRGVEQRGVAVDLTRAFEEHLAETIGRTRSPTVVLIPVARNELIPGLVEGRGDIAMANLTKTPGRQKQVAFSDPVYPDVRELVVTGPAAPKVSSFDDLAGTELHLRPSSSYAEHMKALNAARKKEGQPVIPVRDADENLEDYDLLDMVDKGVLPAIVVDSHKAALWAQIFQDIVVHDDLAVHTGNSIGWALRRESPELLASVNAFVKTARKGTLLGNIIIKRYLGSTQWMEKVLAEEDRARYEATVDLIRRYADRYEFDWLMIAAQGYQESRFDQSKRSKAGAVGIMQIMPSTAADPAVGIPDVSNAENNVHAGVKYLHHLRKRYEKPEISPLDRILLSFAAYNAGPGNVERARRKATAMGFDPNRWFGHVEVAMYRSVSGEPVSYVRNIYKYYVTYKRLTETRKQREEALRKAG
jgi:membrane-bound lytic murein transglycosylase MltF